MDMYYRNILWICITEIYYGFILRNYVTESYYGTILHNPFTGFNYGIIWRNHVTEVYCGNILPRNMTAYILHRKLPALHGLVLWVCVCLHSTALHVASKEPHCTALHGPAAEAMMHGFARKTCKWIPNFMGLHGLAWKVPVHMDPNLAALMELNSARRRPWQA